MDWDKLRIFQAAADAGSFTHAGETLGLSQSAVSRQVGALEADLGAPLFHRHARGLILTEQGDMLLSAVRDVVLKLDAVRSPPDRQPGEAARRIARHHHAGPGRELAGAAPGRVRRTLPRGQASVAAVGRGPRPRHARGGCGAASARADSAGPDPPPAVHRAFPRLRVGRLFEEAPAAAQQRGSRLAPSGRLRRADRDPSPLRSEFAPERGPRSQESAHAADIRQQSRSDDASGGARGRHRRPARTIACSRSRAWCACCRRPTCRKWIASSSTPRR